MITVNVSSILAKKEIAIIPPATDSREKTHIQTNKIYMFELVKQSNKHR